ncbi:MAG TPA: heme exporter protein CcmB [Gemmatimonadaceae bacterium]
MNRFRQDLDRVGAIVWKDLLAERRSKAGFNAVAFLGVLILLLFGFALGPDAEALREAAAGALWLAILFAGVLAFNRSYQLELDGAALEPLLLYPAPRWTIFAGKFIANLLFVLLLEVIVVPAAIVLFQVKTLAGWLPASGVLLLGSIGFVALGTFYASMASRSRAREVLLPLLLFPMLVPVLLASAEASASLLAGNPMQDAGAWVKLLAAFDVIFLVASFLAFDHVIEV